jgi:hypothetical protein
MQGHPPGQQVTTLRLEHPPRVITYWPQHMRAALRRTDRPQCAHGFNRPDAFAYDHVGEARWAAVQTTGRVENPPILNRACRSRFCGAVGHNPDSAAAKALVVHMR